MAGRRQAQQQRDRSAATKSSSSASSSSSSLLSRRWVRWSAILAIALAVWLTFLFEWVPVPDSRVRQLVMFAPLLVLCAFGSFSLALIGYRLMTFPAVPDAAVRLRAEIIEARQALSKLGVSVGDAGDNNDSAGNSASGGGGGGGGGNGARSRSPTRRGSATRPR